MIRFSSVLLLLLSGCLYQPDMGQDVAPEPAPSGDAVADAAESVIRSYAASLAAISRKNAAKAESFKSNSDLYDAASKENVEVWKSAFEGLEAASDEACPPTAKYDPAAIRKLLESQAAGFERIVK